MPSRVSPQDPIAIVVASVVAIIGALGLWTKWGLTADDAAQLGGAALALAAALRTILAALKKPASPEAAINPELGPQFVAAVVDELDRRAVPRAASESTTKRLDGDVPADG